MTLTRTFFCEASRWRGFIDIFRSLTPRWTRISRFLDEFHFTNGVIIQPSFLSTENHYLLSALERYPHRLRGVVVIDPARDFVKLEEWNNVGCAGFRFNLFDLPDPILSDPSWRKALRKIRELDWQVELHTEARRLPEIVPTLLDAGVKVVVDHFGQPDPTLGVNDPGFHYLLSGYAAFQEILWAGPDDLGERLASHSVRERRNLPVGV